MSVSRGDDGKLKFSYSSGGLATAMSSLDTDDQIWVGWPGIASDDLTASEKALITREFAKQGCYPVHLTNQQIADFYEGYANDTLWPLFHYFPSLAKYNDAYWQAYQDVNQQFLRAVKKCSTPRAKIWVQDYQLMLLPGAIRNVLPDAEIGFFLHIPFPSFEIFRLIPQRKELIEGLLGADLLGFHIYDYARHFISTCSHLLGTTSEQGLIEYEGRRVKVDAFPIGIDYKKFRDTLNAPETKAELARLNERYEDQKILLSVDRLDYSKGIMQRLEAYDHFLKYNPRYHKRVTMIMVAVPSRTAVETYQQLRDQIERTVSRINGTYGTTDWSPISYQFQNLQFEHIVALYAKSDVALVTPLRDGMNLVAKEYVASKRGRTGVLVLSDMTGAADELDEALQINPNNISGLSETIKRALSMPKKEQLRRLKGMQARISDYTVQRWGSDFLSELDIARRSHLGALNKRLTDSHRQAIIDHYLEAKSRLLLFDYDGTLHAFSKSTKPSAVKPPLKLKLQLAHISQQPNTTVCIISGRPRRALDEWFGNNPNIILVAEHGAWIKQKGTWAQNTEPFDKTTIIDTMRRYALRTAGASIEEKDFAVVWHYRRVEAELAYMRNASLRRELNDIIQDSDLGVYNGNKIIEVKPKSIHKGSVARHLSETHPSEFILCVGDDYTDEHMFEALPASATTIKVGFGSTHAKHQIRSVTSVLRFIEQLSRAR